MIYLPEAMPKTASVVDDSQRKNMRQRHQSANVRNFENIDEDWKLKKQMEQQIHSSYNDDLNYKNPANHDNASAFQQNNLGVNSVTSQKESKQLMSLQIQVDTLTSTVALLMDKFDKFHLNQ